MAKRFRREISWAARLQHPLIVPLLSSGVAGSHLSCTMPLVDGESLRTRTNCERPMARADIARNNMFFHGRAVVRDFGIGKAPLSAATEETEVLRITQDGMSLGTPLYVAPEQARADPGLDHHSDPCAQGVVASEMLTGHPPIPRSLPSRRCSSCRRTPGASPNRSSSVAPACRRTSRRR